MTSAGAKCDQPVSLMDLYPTLVELAGFDQPSHLDGQSLFPQIKNPEAKTSPVITSYKFSWSKNAVVGHSVRSKRYRYIYYPEINLEELYDHDIDPNEWNNAAYKEDNKEIIGEHREVLLQLLPHLLWKEGDPDGYLIDNTGNVRNTNFVSTFR